MAGYRFAVPALLVLGLVTRCHGSAPNLIAASRRRSLKKPSGRSEGTDGLLLKKIQSRGIEIGLGISIGVSSFTNNLKALSVANAAEPVVKVERYRQALAESSKPSLLAGLDPPTVNLRKQAIIAGKDIQTVSITLYPGQTIQTRPNLLVYRSKDVEMKTAFRKGLLTRFLTRNPIFPVHYTYKGKKQGQIVLNRRGPSKILRLDLNKYGRLKVRKGTLMVSTPGVKLRSKLFRSITEGVFGGQGIFLQTLEGDEQVLVTSGSIQIRKTLRPDETLRVLPSSIIAYSADMQMEFPLNTGILNVLFGDEGILVAKLRGPGTAWFQGLNPNFSQSKLIKDRTDSDGRNGWELARGFWKLLK